MKQKFLANTFSALLVWAIGFLALAVITFFFAAQFHIIKKPPTFAVALADKSEINLGGEFRLFMTEIDTRLAKATHRRMLNLEFAGKTYELFSARKEASMEVFTIDQDKYILIFKDVENGGSSNSESSETIMLDKRDSSVSIVDFSEITEGFNFTCSYSSIGILDNSVGIYYSKEGCDTFDFFPSFASRKLPELPLIRIES
jgi:hypothetical protein